MSARQSRARAVVAVAAGVLLAGGLLGPTGPAPSDATAATSSPPPVARVAVRDLVPQWGTVVVGEAVRVVGKAPESVPAGRGVVLQRRSGDGWRTVARTQVRADGTFRAWFRGAAPATVTLRARGDGDAFTTRWARVRVIRARLALQPQAGAVVTHTTTVRVVLNSGRSGRDVTLDIRSGTRWTPLAHGATGPDGTVALSWTPVSAGPAMLRARVLPAPRTAIVTSPVARLTVSAVPPDASPSAPPQPDPSGSSVPSPPTASAPVPVDGPHLVSVDGQRMNLDCRGQGGPTLVLTSGVWGTTSDWDRQVDALRQGGRTCTYDRPGLGASPARTGSTDVDAGLHARELRDLLTAAGESGPFLLVGHSYGGLVVRALQRVYPDDVAGLLLLDAVPAGFETVYSGYGTTLEEAGTTIDLPRSTQVIAGTGSLAHLPLVVLSAGTPLTWAPGWAAALWTQQQHATAAASDDSLDLVALGGLHQLQEYAPQLTLTAITTLRNSVRAGTPLPGCGPDWSALSAACTSH